MTHSNLNLILLVGRAGADPETRYFESGSCLTKLSLAVDRRQGKDAPPDWFDLEIWGKTAEIAANYVKKGSAIGIQGEFKLDEWTDRNTGTFRSKPVVRVNSLELLGSPNAESNIPNVGAAPASTVTTADF
ncbi:single-stranded DNA-binding protein [Lusitaniella coriacea]|uniref:single-stranded DNA-binding protein n=1 Tax=Lusitaniella coriacea TaxID=1983105 RepID=UPI003CED8E4D